MLDGILAEASAAGAREDRRVERRWTLAQPRIEDLHDIAAQRRAAELSPLAVTTEVGARVERHVLPAKRGQLGDAQARLDGDEQDRAVASSDPCGGVGGVEKCLDLFVAEKLDDPALEAPARDREHALAVQRVGGVGGGHGAYFLGPVARSVASWRSSGTASMYQ